MTSSLFLGSLIFLNGIYWIISHSRYAKLIMVFCATQIYGYKVVFCFPTSIVKSHSYQYHHNDLHHWDLRFLSWWNLHFHKFSVVVPQLSAHSQITPPSKKRPPTPWLYNHKVHGYVLLCLKINQEMFNHDFILNKVWCIYF